MVDLAPVVAAGEALIPQLGLGTFQLRGKTCSDVVASAIAIGYRHVDTAQGYGNEAAVGAGVAESGVPREQIFITTKVQPQRMSDGDLQRSVEESLVRLGTSYVDLVLLHWPNPAIPLRDTIRALNEVKRRGLARHIGLSNFTARRLEEALELTEEPFVAEQIEYHPFLDQRIMLERLRAAGMAIIAYCPLALGRVIGEPAIERIARQHKATPAQVSLRWLVQQPGVVAIPKTASLGRLQENLSIYDFTLTDGEAAEMAGLVRPGSRLICEPQWVPKWDS